jgi:hypothetical protein
MLAYDYPILGLFWTMLMFFLFFAWIMILIRVFADIFRNHDMGGVAKALWSIFIIFFPFLGVFIYLIAHGRSMAMRNIEAAKAQDDAFRTYVKGAAGSGTSAADELTKLADLKDRGVITDAEYAQQKAKLLV